MTGFARAEARQAGCVILWELKSVNSKSLDMRMRLPPGLDRLEAPVREAVQARFARGTIFGSLAISWPCETSMPQVNELWLRRLAEIAMQLHAETGCGVPRADGLLALRGVLEPPAAPERSQLTESVEAEIHSCLTLALDLLLESRRKEGQALGFYLRRQIDRIEELTLRAEADPCREPQAIRERLKQLMQPLLQDLPNLDEQRLHQEAAMIATRVDIREEIDRLRAHVEAARALLDEGKVIGRKLDFLAQEFNREANTLCAKSHAASTTAIGLELKAVVDQFREQVQNLE